MRGLTGSVSGETCAVSRYGTSRLTCTRFEKHGLNCGYWVFPPKLRKKGIIRTKRRRIVEYRHTFPYNLKNPLRKGIWGQLSGMIQTGDSDVTSASITPTSWTAQPTWNHRDAPPRIKEPSNMSPKGYYSKLAEQRHNTVCSEPMLPLTKSRLTPSYA